MAHEIQADALLSLRVLKAPSDLVRRIELAQQQSPCDDCTIQSHDHIRIMGVDYLACRTCGSLTPWRRPSRIARMWAWLMAPIV
jgi:uncharacterized paraquat-inducible protein A